MITMHYSRALEWATPTILSDMLTTHTEVRVALARVPVLSVVNLALHAAHRLLGAPRHQCAALTVGQLLPRSSHPKMVVWQHWRPRRLPSVLGERRRS